MCSPFGCFGNPLVCDDGNPCTEDPVIRTRVFGRFGEVPATMGTHAPLGIVREWTAPPESFLNCDDGNACRGYVPCARMHQYTGCVR